eukprot:jgi/Bigna1/79863/fgenesh1_pg.66_\
MKDVIKLGEKWIKQELRMQDLNNKLPMGDASNDENTTKETQITMQMLSLISKDAKCSACMLTHYAFSTETTTLRLFGMSTELRAERLERERKDREEKRKLAAKNRKAKEDAVAEAMRKKAEEEEKKYKESLLKLQKQEEEERDKLIAEILLRAEGSQEAMRRVHSDDS